MNNETLDFIQEQLEYEFDEPKLLRQAFTRKSYSEEHNGAYHNEVLEFYGDISLVLICVWTDDMIILRCNLSKKAKPTLK